GMTAPFASSTPGPVGASVGRWPPAGHPSCRWRRWTCRQVPGGSPWTGWPGYAPAGCSSRPATPMARSGCGIQSPASRCTRGAGRPVGSMTAVAMGDIRPWEGTDLVTVYHDRTVDVWGSGAVHGNRSDMAPDSRKLVAVGHQCLVGAAVSPARLGYRRPVLLV